jgi:molybdopterin molybdotransferase
MPDQLQLQPSCVDNFELDSLRVEDALQRLDDQIPALIESESIELRNAMDRICFLDINSPIDVPGHANSAMDGFAINIEDLDSTENQEFKVLDTAFAGKPYVGVHRSGTAIRIMTGAVIPDGFNAVIMQEQCAEQTDATVIIGPDHRPDENIRFAGEDVCKNDPVFSAGHKINAADLGVLASLGIANIDVYRKPVVAFFSTGDELISIDKPLQKGQIHDSNRYTLFGLLKKLPVDIQDLGVIKDDPDAIRNALIEASVEADLILTTGGVSVGAADFIKTVLDSIGSIEFWKIAIKPGRPLTYGRINQAKFMGLPGNPVAVMVTFDQFVQPVIEKLSGQGMQAKRLVKAICEEKLRKKSGRREYQRGIASLTADSNWQVRRTGKQGSGILTSMSQANCFIVLNEENQGVDIGNLVDIQFFN